MTEESNLVDEGTVVVGMPVRNAVDHVDRALRNVLDQTHRDLIVVVSDNDSDDGTADVIAAVAAVDRRVRYQRHSPALSAWANFRSVADAVPDAPYFMWAAHDDLRSTDYVERLVAALATSPDAMLAFGELAPFTSYDDVNAAEPVPYDCTTAGRSLGERLARISISACAEVYGVYRREAMAAFAWPEIDYGADNVLLLHVAMLGEIIQVPGARFYQWLPAEPKTAAERAVATSYRRLAPAPNLRLAAVGSVAAARAARRCDRRLPVGWAFLVLYGTLRWYGTKTWLYEHAPRSLRATWRRARSVVSPLRAGGTARGS